MSEERIYKEESYKGYSIKIMYEILKYTQAE